MERVHSEGAIPPALNFIIPDVGLNPILTVQFEFSRVLEVLQMKMFFDLLSSNM
jgi:hypothetical protein